MRTKNKVKKKTKAKASKPKASKRKPISAEKAVSAVREAVLSVPATGEGDTANGGNGWHCVAKKRGLKTFYVISLTGGAVVEVMIPATLFRKGEIVINNERVV